MNRVFTRKTLQGQWSCDTMNGIYKSMDGNQYEQVVANKEYFAKVYPKDSKSKAGDALKFFCQNFGVPKRVNFDGSKEEACKVNTSMKEVLRQGIDYHISEPDIHNHTTVEGVIREVRQK